jgi:hypothetical protein
MDETGVTLFVYKRPDHTERVLEGLRQNDLDELYVFADGPKPDDDVGQIQRVRELVDDIDWCRTHVFEREENWGLAESTISGVDRVFEDNDRIIVLEDDDVPNPNFISYMDRCLDAYADNPRVMNVTGYSPPIEIPDSYPYDVYFTYRDCSWSWGTWQEAWEKYERWPTEIVEQLEKHESVVEERLRKAGDDLFWILNAALDDEVDSWSIWWAIALIRHGGLSVNPIEPYVKNIGHDGTGTHSNATDRYEVSLQPAKPGQSLQLPETPFVHETINARFNDVKTRDGIEQMKYLFGRLVNRVTEKVS